MVKNYNYHLPACLSRPTPLVPFIPVIHLQTERPPSPPSLIARHSQPPLKCLLFQQQFYHYTFVPPGLPGAGMAHLLRVICGGPGHGLMWQQVTNPFAGVAFGVERVVEGLAVYYFPLWHLRLPRAPPPTSLPVINSIRCCIMTLQGRTFHYLLRSAPLMIYVRIIVIVGGPTVAVPAFHYLRNGGGDLVSRPS